MLLCVLANIFLSFVFFFNDTATTEIYTLSLHDALPIARRPRRPWAASPASPARPRRAGRRDRRHAWFASRTLLHVRGPSFSSSTRIEGASTRWRAIGGERRCGDHPVAAS